MIGLELDCPALEALGEAANTGHVPAHRCHVRACPTLLLHSGKLCQDHDTPEVRAMSRPHLYVFAGEHVVLESRPWDEWDAESSPAPARRVPPAPDPAPPQPPQPTVTARPCWAWCGRPEPGPRPCADLPVSRVRPGNPPLQGDVLVCRDSCAPLLRTMAALGPAQTIAAWPEAQREEWDERAALLQAEGMPRAKADRQALLLVWRASRTAARASATPATPAPTPSPATQPAHALAHGAQLTLF
jgi:hypothetical protein